MKWCKLDLLESNDLLSNTKTELGTSELGKVFQYEITKDWFDLLNNICWLARKVEVLFWYWLVENIKVKCKCLTHLNVNIRECSGMFVNVRSYIGKTVLVITSVRLYISKHTLHIRYLIILQLIVQHISTQVVQSTNI